MEPARTSSFGAMCGSSLDGPHSVRSAEFSVMDMRLRFLCGHDLEDRSWFISLYFEDLWQSIPHSLRITGINKKQSNTSSDVRILIDDAYNDDDGNDDDADNDSNARVLR